MRGMNSRGSFQVILSFLILFSALFGKSISKEIERKYEHLRGRGERGYVMDLKERDEVFDWRSANSSVSLSALAYCSNETIMSGNYSDAIPISDFSPTKIIYNRYYDVNGFIGVSKKEKTIFVVFRGSETITNWLDDFETLMTSYPLCPQCEVHQGFYYSSQSVKTDVITWTQELQIKYPSFDVIVTGHSLGGALATLTAMNLVTAQVNNVKHFSFGSPRVGNAAAAAYISNNLPTITRTTHLKDIVPHTPFVNFRYVHVSGEWYEDDKGEILECMGYEDPKCADQWTYSETVADHMKYLGRNMWCMV
jgi:predicted lipase